MSAWTARLIETADGARLAAAVDHLLTQQTAAWPLLAQGVAGLSEAETKTLAIGAATIAVRHIPHRMRNTTAKVDAASVQARPCFLCVDHLPPEQKGVGFGEEWVALANPFPILGRHLTIVHRDHTPQRCAGRFPDLLALAQALPGYFVIYNGPECGASAPDHLHFQACERTFFPIEPATREQPGPVALYHPSRPVVLRGEDPAALAAEMARVAAALQALTGKEPEPLLNAAAFWSAAGYTAYLFPRRRHRPAAFDRGERLVSPAAIDLCGVLVTPRAADYETLTAREVAALFDEVTLGPADLGALAARLGWRA
jgi:hypothetical protein